MRCLRRPSRFVRALREVLCAEEGATAVEYAVMLSLIAGVCIASVLVMSNAAGQSFDDSATQLSSVLGS
ncbi:Flp family type IVb pilin [Botrimarina mediterranea]|uniref:Flp/Fap pilin component n=1 Tax=Botrimarina mediterranea TaxID=2528022 RepID=A0A518K5N4_9BACT|nr:Flp family type IVb pilin [Botrimarina mediterranea]QDV73096.1 Flp/Fap pilin component [Botrimarina mediterranea]QDV77649.1 Flp/Fap pilin component [Planctomycetes bacterium K2D]